MAELELTGAPLAWLWLFVITVTLALPPVVRGLDRRGTGARHEQSFTIQRAPQLATGLVFSLVTVSFEAIEFSLGTGEPAFGKPFYERFVAFLPVASLALVLPAAWAATVSWRRARRGLPVAAIVDIVSAFRKASTRSAHAHAEAMAERGHQAERAVD